MHPEIANALLHPDDATEEYLESHLQYRQAMAEVQALIRKLTPEDRKENVNDR